MDGSAFKGLGEAIGCLLVASVVMAITIVALVTYIIFT